MNKRIKVICYVSFWVIIGLGLGTSVRVEAGHLVIKGGTVHMISPCGDGISWKGEGGVSKQVLSMGEEFELEGDIEAEITGGLEVGKGKVFLQTLYLTETYEQGTLQGTLSHQSKARVTPGPEPFIYNVQALTTVTGGTEDFEEARGIWSVRGVLDLRCLRGLIGDPEDGDPEDRDIYLVIKGGFIDGPYIPLTF